MHKHHTTQHTLSTWTFCLIILAQRLVLHVYEKLLCICNIYIDEAKCMWCNGHRIRCKKLMYYKRDLLSIKYCVLWKSMLCKLILMLMWKDCHYSLSVTIVFVSINVIYSSYQLLLFLNNSPPLTFSLVLLILSSWRLLSSLLNLR